MRSTQARVQDRYSDRAIGVELVVVIGKRQRRARFQGAGHSRVDGGEPFGEVGEVSVLGSIARQLLR